MFTDKAKISYNFNVRRCSLISFTLIGNYLLYFLRLRTDAPLLYYFYFYYFFLYIGSILVFTQAYVLCAQTRHRHFGTSNSNHLTETVAIAICGHYRRGHVCQPALR